MGKQCTTLMALPVKAAGAVDEYRFVTATGAQAGAGANALGVSEFAAATGEMVSVANLGTAIVEAGAAIAAGAAVQSDADGRAVTKDAGATVARTLEAAAAAGDFIEVALIPN
ncbi:MAG: DUF2190 domain-containing protein [Desulfovibrionaceae bacterium CG1_02_65_16]|nr:MAG: DUF2190 domain-containing protein [Desulfovibrionaceae bacterium CG1_02_65_16]